MPWKSTAPFPATTITLLVARMLFASIFFGDSPNGLFTTPAQCMMHRQASFIPSFFPNQGQELADGEADFFYFPGVR